MVNKIDGPISKLNDAVTATNTFLDATTQKQAAELLSLQESVKQQIELVKTITDAADRAVLATNPRNLADAAWPPMPAAGNAPLNLGPPAFMASRSAVHADPKVMQRVVLAAKQLLIEYGPLDEGEALQPKTLEEQKGLRQLFNDWIDATSASDAVPDQPTPAPSRAVRNVAIFDCPALLLEFDSAESKDKFTEMIANNSFLLSKLSPKARICPRTYPVIFRFIPCNGTFDPSLNDNLRSVERENDLPTNAIIAASWCKRPDRRSPNQTTAILKVACANPDVANRLLTGRIRVDDHLVTVRKDLRIPIRCVKCQEYGHTQDNCMGVKKCANCASEFHRSDKCDRSPSCVSCGPGSNHPSTSASCPSLARRCEALDGCFPENAMPYFPSREDWTWASVPTNPSPPSEAPPPFQQANDNAPSIRPQRQRPQRKEVRYETPPLASQLQACQLDEGWTSVRRRRSSPQHHRQSTITDIWGPQQNPPNRDAPIQHADTSSQPLDQ